MTPLRTFGDKALAYDDNGNLQSITDSNGTTLYQWNARNQLIGISSPNVNATFVYDGMGRRQKKTINGNLTEFLYDGVNPVQESSGATILANILPGLDIDEFLTRTDVVAGTTSNFLADALGSALAVTDNAGAVRTEYIYEAFGKTTATGVPNDSSYQYTGRENDGTGLHYYRSRFYHAELQRFLSEDPTEFDGGDVNLYSYVSNSPINDTDPWGLRAIPTPIGPLPLPLPMPNPIPWTPSHQRQMEDFFRDLLEQLTSRGNQVDTQVRDDYQRYLEQEKACGRTPLNRCDWLRQNRKNYRIDQWRPTEKAWNCRPHR